MLPGAELVAVGQVGQLLLLPAHPSVSVSEHHAVLLVIEGQPERGPEKARIAALVRYARAEAGAAAGPVAGVQVKGARLTAVTIPPLHVFFATTESRGRAGQIWS